MSVHRMTVLAPRRVPMPRGADWAAQATVYVIRALQRAGRSIWLALERFGRRRAAHELHELAQRWQHSDPALARALREPTRLESEGA